MWNHDPKKPPKKSRGYSKFDKMYVVDGLALALMAHVPIGEGDIVLEPHVGGGAFAVAAWAKKPKSIDIVDISGKADGMEYDFGGEKFVTNFLKFKPTKVYDMVIGSPPFASFGAHVKKAFRLGVNVAFLVSDRALHGITRVDLYRQHPPDRILFIVEPLEFISSKGRVKDQANRYVMLCWGERFRAAGTPHAWVSWRSAKGRLTNYWIKKRDELRSNEVRHVV